MKNILLVDDNKIIVDGLIKITNWTDNGFFIAGIAYDGEEALNIYKNTDIDIIITDIKMPNTNGIELIKQIKRDNEYISIIVLSSYDEFSLVHDAFKYGANEYILKTDLEPEKIISTCKKLSNDQDYRKNEQKKLSKQLETLEKFKINFNSIEKQLYESRLVIQNKYLHLLFTESLYSYDNIIEKIDKYGIVLKNKYYSAILVNVDNYNFIVENNEWAGDHQLLDFAIQNIFEDTLIDFDSVYSCNFTKGRFFLLLTLDEIMDKRNYQSLVNNIYIQAKENLYNALDLKISAGVSEQTANINNLSKKKIEASKACYCRLVLGKGSIYFFNDICTLGKVDICDIEKKVKTLRKFLENPAFEYFNKVDSIKVKNSKNDLIDLEKVHSLFEKYIVVLADFAQKYKLEDEYGIYIKRFYNSLYKKGSIDELNQWLEDILRMFVDESSCKNPVVRNCRRYIHNNYHNDISLNILAEKFNVSSSYLSMLFRKELGKGFSEYLNTYRVEKAKELISTSKYKVYEIAHKTGYNNAEHFTRVFKKYTGKSPKQYE